MGAAQPIYIRPGQAPAVFGVSRSTIYKWAKKGHVRIYKQGEISLVKVTEVENFITGLGDQLGDQDARSPNLP